MSPSTDAHAPALDGLRGIAALLVMEYHFFAFAPIVRAPGSSLSFVDRAANALNTAGWTGVDLFFVLSGFLITRILLESKNQAGYFRNFYARRALRIAPVYYGFLFVLIVVLPLFAKFADNADLHQLRQHQWWYWSYFFNVWASMDPGSIGGAFRNGHFWTLSVEEQFYLVWPALVLLLSRRNLGIACVTAIVAAFFVRGGLIHWANTESAYVLTPARMDSLAVGALIALTTTAGLTGLTRWARPAIALSLLVLTLVFVSGRNLDPYRLPVETIGISSVAVLFGAALVLVIHASPSTIVSRALSSGPLTFFGRYSYAMYIFHIQVCVQINHRLIESGKTPPVTQGLELPGRLFYCAAATVVVVVVSWLCWHLYEKQFLKLKDRFRSAPPQRTQEAVAVPIRALP